MVWKDMSPRTINKCWNKVQILLVVLMVDITSQYEWEKGKKEHEIEDLNMLIDAMHLRKNSLSIEHFINLPGEQHVFISLIVRMKSLPNGNLVHVILNLLLKIQTHTCVTY
jgi:hypothetical protein